MGKQGFLRNHGAGGAPGEEKGKVGFSGAEPWGIEANAGGRFQNKPRKKKGANSGRF